MMPLTCLNQCREGPRAAGTAGVAVKPIPATAGLFPSPCASSIRYLQCPFSELRWQCVPSLYCYGLLSNHCLPLSYDAAQRMCNEHRWSGQAVDHAGNVVNVVCKSACLARDIIALTMASEAHGVRIIAFAGKIGQKMLLHMRL